jgi:hypothetical protein
LLTYASFLEDDREVRFYGPVGLPPVTVSMKVSLEFIPTPPKQVG